MLSILIPIYNCSVIKLVEDLHLQCEECAIDFEIILLDDYSTQVYKTKNRVVSRLPNVNYEELSSNIGRSRIRNLLAKKANFPYLLFIDADAKVAHNQFIYKYLESLPRRAVLYGGCQYATQPPKNTRLHLHYYFGIHREVIPVARRRLSPYQSFKTFNFLIAKSVFETIRFDEQIRHYGHEDTLFGQALAKQQIPILHLDNPLEHIGLEPTTVFLKKQERALQTLYQLHLNQKQPHSRLLQLYQRLEKWGTSKVVYKLLHFSYPVIKQQLFRPNPKMFYLDLFKLYHWLGKHENRELRRNTEDNEN